MRRLTLLQKLNFLILLAIAIVYPGQNLVTKLSNLAPPQVLSATVELASVDLPITQQPIASLSAEAAIVYDLDSGTLMFAKNPDHKLHPASTTKIMTALVAIDTYQPDDIITIKTADQAIGNTMHLLPGDQLYAKDLLYGLLVASANDAAVAFAENYPDGGYLGFVAAMNNKAKQLQLRNSHFTNVSGIEGTNHKTTALDLAILTQQAIKNPTFSQIVSTSYLQVTDITGTNLYPVQTTNQLLGRIPGLVGVKTGWTENAGECLVTLVERDGHRVLTVVLNSADRFGETTKLINWAFRHRWESIPTLMEAAAADRL